MLRFLAHLWLGKFSPQNLVMQMIMFVMLVVCLYPTVSCKEIDYVQPFRWGKMRNLFYVKGAVKEIVDSIYTLETLSNGNIIYHTETKKEILSVKATSDGYPYNIFIKGDDNYSLYPLDSNFSVTINIDPNQHIFESSTAVIGDDTAKVIIYFPYANSFTLKSSSKQRQELNVMSYNYDNDFNVKSLSYWTSNQIEKRKIYTSGVGSESVNRTFDFFVGDELSNTGSEEGNPLSSSTMKINITDIAIQAVYIYEYQFGGRDVDPQQNYTSIVIKKDGIPVAKIERTIRYY